MMYQFNSLSYSGALMTVPLLLLTNQMQRGVQLKCSR